MYAYRTLRVIAVLFAALWLYQIITLSLNAVLAAERLMVLLLLGMVIAAFVIRVWRNVGSLRFDALITCIRTQTRTRWSLSLAAFAIFHLLAEWIAPITTNTAEPIRVMGFVSCVVFLLAGKHLSTPEKSATRRTVWIISIAIVIGAIFTSSWLFVAAPPNALDDSLEYFAISQQILSNERRMDGFLSESPFNYGYSAFLSFFRQFDNSLVLAIVVQHVVRGGAALFVYHLLRRTDHTIAAAVGLLMALAPQTAIYTHYMLTEGLYLAMLVLWVVFAWRAIIGADLRFYAIVGLLSGLILVVRPVGQYLIVLLLPLIIGYMWRGAVRKHVRGILVLGGAFALSLLLVAGGRWLVDGNFRVTPNIGANYFFAPIGYYDLYNPTNGPISAQYAEALNASTCQYPDALQREVSGVQFGRTLFVCAEQFTADSSTPVLPSFSALYFESLLAQPLDVITNFATESREFLAAMHNPTLRLKEKPTLLGDMPLPVTNPVCVNNPNNPFARYVCSPSAENVPVRDAARGAFGGWLQVSTALLQPYTLPGDVGSSFWGMLALVVFVMREMRSTMRVLLLLSALVIFYHTAVTVVTVYAVPRYFYVLLPLVIFFTACVFVTIWRGIGEKVDGAKQEHSIFALLPRPSQSVLVRGRFDLLGAQPVNLQFEGRLVLESWRYYDGFGQDQHLELAWRRVGSLGSESGIEEEDLRVFVHVIDSETGEIIRQGDSELPADGAEQFILDTAINIARLSHPVTLRLGVYSFTSGVRMTLTDMQGQWVPVPGDNSIPLILEPSHGIR